MEQISGVAGGVPYLALPLRVRPTRRWRRPGTCTTRSETAMAGAPLSGLPAWRVYLGLPLSGSRLPRGGPEAFFQLGYQDAVLKVLEPTCRQAVEEFPRPLAGLRQALPLGDGPLGLLGPLGLPVFQPTG
jgi:hypothetical protein